MVMKIRLMNYAMAPITSHIIVMAAANRTPPINSKVSFRFSDIVL